MRGVAPSPAVRETPAELLPVVEFAKPILGAADRHDVEVQLERGIFALIKALPETLEIPTTISADELPEPQDGGVMAHTLGIAVAKELASTMRESLRDFPLLFGLLSEMFNPETEADRSTLLKRVLLMIPGKIPSDYVIPNRLLLAVNSQAKGTVALGALLAACVQRRRPEAWLSKALAEAWSNGVRENSWVLHSLVSGEMSKLFREAEEADAAFLLRFEADVRAGRTDVPLED